MEKLFSAAAQPQSGTFPREAWSAALRTGEAEKARMERAMSATEGEQRQRLPFRYHYFRGSKRTSTSVATLTGWPPLIIGL